MTIATWVLALATVVLAAGGGAALQGWLSRVRIGKKRQELEQIRREISILHHALWMDVTTTNQGTRPEVDAKVRVMLQIDGWTPDMSLAEQAGYFSLQNYSTSTWR